MFSFPTSFTKLFWKYKVFWKVCSIIFVLSHGQSAVERGFSINKELLVENLQEKSLVPQRVVYDHINSNKSNICEYKLPSDLLKSCKLSNRRYSAAPEETKEQEKIGTVARKWRLINKDIQVAKKKNDEVTKCIEVLKTDADKLSIEEGERASLDLTKANSFKKQFWRRKKYWKT